ncbi:hypothetical protein ACPVPU_04220 [Sphingomonas sp. CJ99]
MSLTTILGAAIGSAIDGAEGEDSAVDGMVIGVVVAHTLRIVVPAAIVGTVGWLAWRKAKATYAGLTARRSTPATGVAA